MLIFMLVETWVNIRRGRVREGGEERNWLDDLSSKTLSFKYRLDSCFSAKLPFFHLSSHVHESLS